MANKIDEIIELLKQQRTAIEHALMALESLEGSGSPAPTAASTPAVKKQAKAAKRKGGMSPEGKARLIEALKRRWAAKKAGVVAAPATKKTAGKRGRPKKVS